ncbi:MAG: oligopeptide/dipeptide ABC transporter ATP-binding protein [Thermoplasmata archaeon]
MEAEEEKANGEKGKVWEVRDLTKLFPIKAGFLASLLGREKFVHALNEVTFDIYDREILGIVGESGCGKTTCGRLLVRLENPTKGEMYFRGQEIGSLKGKELKAFRRNVQMVFQDPYESLNPRLTVFATVAEPLIVHGVGDTIEEREDLVARALEYSELKPPEEFMYRYPHELSGGQRQRVAISRTLVLRPQFIVADEPVSMLDVSIRAGIMNLMLNLRDEYGIPFMFISHDVSVTRYMSDRIAVMYLGGIVELGETEQVIKNPMHPYTEALLSAVPVPDPKAKHGRVKIRGELPSPIELPSGCTFHPRCLYRKEICSKEKPMPKEVEKGHFVQCHFAGELAIVRPDDEYVTERVCKSCNATIKEGMPSVECECGSVYHEECAGKLEECAVCGKRL